MTSSISPSVSPPTLLEAAIAVLSSRQPGDKCAAADHAITALGDRAALGKPTGLSLPNSPARPDLPKLTPPGDVPKRRVGSVEGRIALLHAIAHIEFNAIDLAFDMAARFAGEISHLGLDAAQFTRDWFGVGADEARHFGVVQARLGGLGAAYGDLPAHNGLWEAALGTSHSVQARLAIAPLILEARGLDVTPGMIDRLKAAGDHDSAAILQVIYQEEIGHVACGKRWFHAVCKAKDMEPLTTFRALKKAHFAGQLKPPFNHAARAKAGLAREFYEPY